ncbi:MAG: hypothetical protein RLZZ299_849 [Pseudomonadota bacterium]
MFRLPRPAAPSSSASSSDGAGKRLPRDLRGRDLSDADLRGADLRNADLRHAVLDRARLEGARLDGADLRGASLCQAVLDDAVLDGADLRGAVLDGAHVDRARFCDTLLHLARLDDVVGERCDFRRSEGHAAVARRARLPEACWDGAAWIAADLPELHAPRCHAAGARFDAARLAGADLRDARLDDTVFDRADLAHADLRGTRALRATFADALGPVDLRRADLRGADLRLRGAEHSSWDGARLARARFRTADVTVMRATLDGAGWQPSLPLRAGTAAARVLGLREDPSGARRFVFDAARAETAAAFREARQATAAAVRAGAERVLQVGRAAREDLLAGEADPLLGDPMVDAFPELAAERAAWTRARAVAREADARVLGRRAAARVRPADTPAPEGDAADAPIPGRRDAARVRPADTPAPEGDGADLPEELPGALLWMYDWSPALYRILVTETEAGSAAEAADITAFAARRERVATRARLDEVLRTREDLHRRRAALRTEAAATGRASGSRDAAQHAARAHAEALLRARWIRALRTRADGTAARPDQTRAAWSAWRLARADGTAMPGPGWVTPAVHRPAWSASARARGQTRAAQALDALTRARAMAVAQRLDALEAEEERAEQARIAGMPEELWTPTTPAAVRAVAGQAGAHVQRWWLRTTTRTAQNRRPVVLAPGANLELAELENHELRGVDLRGAVLTRARMAGADLRDARLAGADLRGADLSTADLRGADLRGADVSGADFDQALLAGALLEEAVVRDAWMTHARGLTTRERQELRLRGADLGEDIRVKWVVRLGTAGAVSAGLLVAGYLVARFVAGAPDRAMLEQAAADAQMEGDPAAAAERFAALARDSKGAGDRGAFLLEAAASAEEAADTARALDYYARAVEVLRGTSGESTALLRQAHAFARFELPDAAGALYETLLDRADLTSVQQAEALVGFARTRRGGEPARVGAEQARLLAAAATADRRRELALALADGWASIGRIDASRAVLVGVLEATERGALRGDVPPPEKEDERLPLQLRLAHFLAQDGAADEALALYRQLTARSPEARLGAAELLARRGDDAGAETLLDALRTQTDDAGARARVALAQIAVRRSEEGAAADLLRPVLAWKDLDPRVLDEARMVLARVLVTTDPSASDALVSTSPALRGALLLGQARALRDAGKRSEARARWSAAFEDASLDADTRHEARIALSELDVEDGNAEMAIERYEDLLAETLSASLRSRVQLGMAGALVRAGRLQQAEARYDAIVQLTGFPDAVAQARIGLARCAELRGQLDRAGARYAQVGAADGRWAFEALLALGELRQQTGDLAGATDAFRLARTRTGVDADRRVAADIALAQVLDVRGDPEAASLYATLLGAPDPEVRVQARLAVAGRALGADAARARTLYEEALAEAGPTEFRVAARAGWTRATVALGEVEDALTRLRAWLETEQDRALRGELALAAVKALRAEGRATEAEALAGRYAEVGGFELGMEHAGLLRELGRAREAASLLEPLRATSREDESWRLETRAEALLDAGELDAAQRTYERLASLAGGNAAANLGLARIAHARGDASRALALLGQASDPRAPAERAAVLETLGRLDEAETAWKRLVLAPDLEQRSAGTVGLARVRLGRDNPAGALEALDALQVVDAGYRLTHAQARGEALLALGRFDAARALYATLDFDAEARTVGAIGIAECDLRVDRAAQARDAFRRVGASATDPWYRISALAGEARALVDLGDTTGARALLARIRAEAPGREDAIGSVAAALDAGP